MSPTERLERVASGDGGFTLVEILIAIVLVAILSAVVVVGLGNLLHSGKAASCGASADAARTAATTYFATTGAYPASFADLVAAGGDVFELPDGATVGDGGSTLNTPDWVMTITTSEFAPRFTCGRRGANLIQNGSFESPVISARTWGRRVLPGWTTSETDGKIEIWNTFQGSGFTSPLVPTQGAQNAELNGNGPATISQSVTVTPGQQYEWSFDHRGRLIDDTIEVIIDGVAVTRVTTPKSEGWNTFRGVVTPSSSTLVFSLRAINSGSIGNLLDNVQLVSIGVD